MVGKENHDGIFRMGALIEGIQYPTDLLISPTDGRKVGMHRQLPTVLLLHPVVDRDFGITHRYLAGGIGDIVPIIFENLRQFYLFKAVINPTRRKKRHMRTIKSAGQKKGFVGFLPKLLSNPACSNMIGEF